MELEISPEPSPEERLALEQAVARLLADLKPPRSEWARRGLEEQVYAEGREDAPEPGSEA